MKLTTTKKGKLLEVWINHGDSWLCFGSHNVHALLKLQRDFCKAIMVLQDKHDDLLSTELSDLKNAIENHYQGAKE